MSIKKATFKAAFSHTIPVLAGFLVLGAAYGILMDSKGFNVIWTILTSTFIYAGSMQFVAVAMLASGFNPIAGFLMTIMVNARHLFYGISLLEKYRGLGRLKPYFIFSLTDETFSLICSANPPEHADRRLFMFYISALNHIYWIMGSFIGSILGGMFQFNTKGIDFVLTALFVVIFLNQWKGTTNHLPAILGVSGAVFCRFIFGAKDFIIPSMIVILLMVTVLRQPMERRGKG